MRFDSVPERRMLPGGKGREDPGVTRRKYALMVALLHGELGDIDVKFRPTVIDFHGLPPNSTQDDLLKWIEKELSIPSEVITGSSPETRMTIKILNEAYQLGKEFLNNTLKYREDELKFGPSSIASSKDIFALLNKTKLRGEVHGLSRAVSYCRLVKATIIAYEALKNDVRMLKELTNEFESELVSPISRGTKEVPPFVFLREGERGRKHFYASWAGNLQGSLNSRGKLVESFMLRFLTRPESSAKEASRDAIGVRITIEKNKGGDLVQVLCQWFVRNQGVDFISIENKNYLSSRQMKAMEESLSEILSANNFSLQNAKSDSTSMGQFEALVIRGTLPALSRKNVSPHVRQFEIQLVDPDNRNERGEKDHDTYHVAKCVAARTRLDGGCPEGAFEELVKEASQRSRRGEDTIKYDLLERKNEATGETAVVKVRKPNGRAKEFFYVAKSVYSRWREFGWVDASIVDDIVTAQNKG